MSDPIIAKGQLLARVDDTEYLSVRAVYAVADGGTPALYCLEADWPLSPMARIAALEARIRDLESQLPAVVTVAIDDARPGPDRRQRKCPYCRARPRMAGLEAHIAREHPAAALPPPQGVTDELVWRCAAPGCRGTFARDMRDPAHCTQHAERSANGHEVRL